MYFNLSPPDVALASASPQSLRRIKNNLSSSETFQIRSTEPNRNSMIAINGTLPPKQPKQTNWETSGAHQRVANQSVDSGVSSPGDHQRSPDGDQTRSRKSRHVYEDVERSRPPVRHNYEDVEILTAPRVTNSRTSNWVNTHSEIGWGKKEGSGREGSGSMWAPQNRTRRAPQRQESFERERDLTRTYHAPTSSRSYSQRPRASNTLPTTPSSPGQVKRRISYVSAMGGPPTEVSNDRFSSTLTPTRFSQSSTQHRTPRGFDSLQRPISTASSTRRPRRGSESSSDRADIERFEEAKAMLLQAAPTKEPPVHRTRSHGPAPIRGRPGGEGLVRTGSGRQVGQSYNVKQSLL